MIDITLTKYLPFLLSSLNSQALVSHGQFPDLCLHSCSLLKFPLFPKGGDGIEKTAEGMEQLG